MLFEPIKATLDTLAPWSRIPMNAAFGPVMITIGLFLAFFTFYGVVLLVQAKLDASSGKSYPDNSN
jgi:hypothetical protein